jgi:glycosyltransferase involved in cell wall biosynthesis
MVSQPFFEWRGSPIRVRYNVEALVEAGYQVELLTLPFGQPVELPGVTIHRVSGLPGVRSIPIGPSFAKLLFDLKMFFKARALLSVNTYAVIHGVEDAGFFAGLLARKRGIPFIYEKHSDPASHQGGFLRNLLMSVYSRVESYSLKRAGHVIATGAGLQASVRKLAPDTPCTHLFDIPSSRSEPDDGQVNQARSRMNAADNNVVATYVGSFARYQGIDLLFEAIPTALRADPDLQVVIIGGTDQEIAERTLPLQQLGLTDRVQFLGKVDPEQLPAYLRASDILLSPRISGHNTPLKLLDYFKAGRAIVATDVEANRLLLDEQTAAFAPPDAEFFGTVLAETAPNPDLRRELAAHSQEKIRTTYNVENYTRQLAGVYHELLTQAPPL